MQHVPNSDHIEGRIVNNPMFAMGQEIDYSLMSLRSSWPNLVADLGYQYGSCYMKAETLSSAPNVSPNGNWVQIAGYSKAGAFNIYLPAKACATLLELAHSSLDLVSLDGADAALVLEHVFSSKLAALETLFQHELTIVKIADVTIPVSEELLGFELEVYGEKYQGALGIQNRLRDILEGVCSRFAMPGEKELDPKMIIHLGPVVVPTHKAYLARTGEAIDCGVNPSDTIKGVLMRCDGRYWPIHIEDEEIEIVGDLAGPVAFPEEKPENIFVTFGLGEVSLDAYARVNLQIGHRVNISRIPNNGANVYYQTKPFAQGHLSILGPNLAVTLDKIGSF